jgi:hypothetical protein
MHAGTYPKKKETPKAAGPKGQNITHGRPVDRKPKK